MADHALEQAANQTLFQMGDFTLNSGAKSKWKLECDALTDGDWDGLAQMVKLLVGPFSAVAGIPRGGLKLAERLEKYVELEGPHLVVDDVLTTGGSFRRYKDDWMIKHAGTPAAGNSERFGPNKYLVGAVVFARGQCPMWVKAVFEMPECFWLKAATRG
jgi:orotate phosphoribosyltransferase